MGRQRQGFTDRRPDGGARPGTAQDQEVDRRDGRRRSAEAGRHGDDLRPDGGEGAGNRGYAIEIVPVESDLVLARQAARFKASKKLSYADCFAAVLAKVRKAELITGDSEFKQVESEIRIAWLKYDK